MSCWPYLFLHRVHFPQEACKWVENLQVITNVKNFKNVCDYNDLMASFHQTLAIVDYVITPTFHYICSIQLCSQSPCTSIGQALTKCKVLPVMNQIMNYHNTTYVIILWEHVFLSSSLENTLHMKCSQHLLLEYFQPNYKPPIESTYPCNTKQGSISMAFYQGAAITTFWV